MTSLPFFQVDAFAEKPLTGNPAAVMPLDHWLDDRLMQAIAVENNLSETAFAVPSDSGDVEFDLRWFTPATEVPLCGHATLASAHVLMTGDRIRFSTQSGILTVSRDGDLLQLDLPAAPVTESYEPELCAALRVEPQPVWIAGGSSDAAILLLDDEEQVRAVRPDFAKLKAIPLMPIVTAPGREHDIASRVFVSYVGIDEDPVTGAAHAALVPFWAERLGRREFTAIQASERSGLLHCREAGDRVILSGKCVTVIEGHFQL
jgi:PhzF family phenazine biosynthesis protein